jgi:hypothetical protein
LIPKRADLAEFLSTLEFFRDLDEAALRALAATMEPMTLAPARPNLVVPKCVEIIFCECTGIVQLSCNTPRPKL